MRHIYLFYVLLLSAFLVACASAPIAEQPADVTEDQTEEEQQIDADADQVDRDFVEPEPEEVVVFDADVALDRIFYFDFDKADIQPHAFPILDSHAEILKERIATYPDLMVRIEGHCDERGTEEYNIALGQRRAEAVGRYFRVQGVPAANLDPLSWGELDPALDESNEAAWEQNRRVEITY